MHTLRAAEANTRLVVSTWSRVSSKKKGEGRGFASRVFSTKKEGGLPPTLVIFNGRYSTPLSFVDCCHVLSRIVVCKCFKTFLITSILLKLVQMSILIPGWGRGRWAKCWQETAKNRKFCQNWIDLNNWQSLLVSIFHFRTRYLCLLSDFKKLLKALIAIQL